MAPNDRRTEALDIASGLFLRFGYRKTSMDDVARAVGVSRQGLYLWFPNKQALFTATVEALMQRIEDPTRPAHRAKLEGVLVLRGSTASAKIPGFCAERRRYPV